MLKKILASGCAAALCVAPAYAAPTANPAASLSVKPAARATATSRQSQKLAAPGAIIGLVLAAAVIAGGVFIVVDDDDNSDSN
ncbi:hypothetical protein Q5H91_01540 [Sphingomonas sp. KR1UV-12]|uniref:Transmembrane protein n=1 Tax=Sphingomonas aurea TaxID=3063994 RepID=A0ABT9EFZ0_9SPHN|nr:hypothetical protein [Sphingomonas sp. KR1UV-12]MDP1025887.1 hypothetical protein [Sphingomonas sp. KR1UV-12]